MRRVVVLLLTALAGCGEPFAPTLSPTNDPPDPPSAQVVVGGQGQWVDCLPTIGCVFQAEGRNLGPDCAWQLRGVIRFYDSVHAQLGTAYNWRPTELNLRLNRRAVVPNEAFVYDTDDRVPYSIVNATATYEAEVVSVAATC